MNMAPCKYCVGGLIMRSEALCGVAWLELRISADFVVVALRIIARLRGIAFTLTAGVRIVPVNTLSSPRVKLPI